MPRTNNSASRRISATPALKVAIAEARRGNTVVAMVAGTKRTIEKWAHGKRGPIDWRDPDTLRDEWPRRRAADVGVGILTGPSNLVVIDIDPPDGEASLAKLVRSRRGHVIPATRTLATPSGGQQLIFAAPPDREFKTCAGQVAPRIDIRGRGGLFKIWDPTEPERRITDDRDPVEIPKWLADFLPEPDTPTPSANGDGSSDGDGEALDIERLLTDGIEPGRQDDVLTRVIWKLCADGVGKGGAHAMWSTILANSVTGVDANGKPREPWTRADFDAKWGRAEGRLAPIKADFAGFRDIKPIRSGTQRRLAKVRTGDWLYRQEFKPLQYAVPKLLPAGVVVIAGAPFSGKSVLVLRFGLECARGGMVFGMKCKRRDALYLALEDNDARMQERCLDLLDGEPIPARFNYVTEIEPGELIPLVNDWLEENPSGLVTIDTLGKVLERPQRGETTYDRDYRILGKLKELPKRYPDSSIVVNHHNRKAKSDDFVDMVSGTNAIAGAVDTVIVLVRKRNEPEGLLKIVSRDMDDAEYALLLERPFGWRLDGDDLLEAAGKAATSKSKLGDKLGGRSLAVIEFVNDHPEGVTAAEVAAATGLIPRDAKTYLYLNYQSGYIERLKRGTYGPIRKLHVSRLPEEGAS